MSKSIVLIKHCLLPTPSLLNLVQGAHRNVITKSANVKSNHVQFSVENHYFVYQTASRLVGGNDAITTGS